MSMLRPNNLFHGSQGRHWSLIVNTWASEGETIKSTKRWCYELTLFVQWNGKVNRGNIDLRVNACVCTNIPMIYTERKRLHKPHTVFFQNTTKNKEKPNIMILKAKLVPPLSQSERRPRNENPAPHFLFLSWLASQSSPSYRPSPLVAQVACIYQLRWRSEWRPSLSVISAAFIAFGRSWSQRGIKQESRLWNWNWNFI